MLGRYPKFPALGQRDVREIFRGPVEVTEKIDGSQFVFGKHGACSTGSAINIDAPATMFAEAVNYIKTLALPDGVTYYCEYLRKPRHNVLAYGRVPKNHLVLFAVHDAKAEGWGNRARIVEEATILDIDPVPLIISGEVRDAESLRSCFAQESYLGGPIEGVVVVNRALTGQFGGPLTGKFVSDKFKEVADRKKDPHPRQDWTAFLESFRTEARWAKAEQRLRDAGTLTGTVADIGPLLKSVKEDIKAECVEQVLDYVMPEVLRQATAGLPEWWKGRV